MLLGSYLKGGVGANGMEKFIFDFFKVSTFFIKVGIELIVLSIHFYFGIQILCNLKLFGFLCVEKT
jgi:hypothetical protein